MLLVIAYVHCTGVISCSFLFVFPCLKIVSIYCQTMQYVLCTSLEKSPQTNPIIGRIECKAGHGAGRPTQKTVILLIIIFFPLKQFYIIVGLLIISRLFYLQIDEAADRYSFMAKMLDVSWIDQMQLIKESEDLIVL